MMQQKYNCLGITSIIPDSWVQILLLLAAYFFFISCQVAILLLSQGQNILSLSFFICSSQIDPLNLCDCFMTRSKMNPPICLITAFTSHYGSIGIRLSSSQQHLNRNQLYDLQLIQQMKNFRSKTTLSFIFFKSGTMLNFFRISSFQLMPSPQITMVSFLSILSMPSPQKQAQRQVRNGILNCKQQMCSKGLTSAMSSPMVQKGTQLLYRLTWLIIMQRFSIFMDSNPSYLSYTLVPVTLTANYDFQSILLIFQPCFGLLNIYMALSFFFSRD